jgi:hypothetical protein
LNFDQELEVESSILAPEEVAQAALMHQWLSSSIEQGSANPSGSADVEMVAVDENHSGQETPNVSPPDDQPDTATQSNKPAEFSTKKRERNRRDSCGANSVSDEVEDQRRSSVLRKAFKEHQGRSAASSKSLLLLATSQTEQTPEDSHGRTGASNAVTEESHKVSTKEYTTQSGEALYLEGPQSSFDTSTPGQSSPKKRERQRSVAENLSTYEDSDKLHRVSILRKAIKQHLGRSAVSSKNVLKSESGERTGNDLASAIVVDFPQGCASPDAPQECVDGKNHSLSMSNSLKDVSHLMVSPVDEKDAPSCPLRDAIDLSERAAANNNTNENDMSDFEVILGTSTPERQVPLSYWLSLLGGVGGLSARDWPMRVVVPLCVYFRG